MCGQLIALAIYVVTDLLQYLPAFNLYDGMGFVNVSHLHGAPKGVFKITFFFSTISVGVISVVCGSLTVIIIFSSVILYACSMHDV